MRLKDLDKYSDEELLARVLQAEAGNQGQRGIQAVAAVIRNRLASPSYPNTLRGVLTQKGQFSPVNYYTGYAKGEQGVDFDKIRPNAATREIAAQATAGTIEDPTGGALNFVNPSISNPNWYNPDTFTMIGDHAFGTSGGGKLPVRSQAGLSRPPSPEQPPSMAGVHDMIAAQQGLNEADRMRQAGLDQAKAKRKKALAARRKQDAERKQALNLLSMGQKLMMGYY